MKNLHVTGKAIHMDFLCWLRGRALKMERDLADKLDEEPRAIPRAEIGRKALEAHPKFDGFAQARAEDDPVTLMYIRAGESGAEGTWGGPR